MNPTPAQLPHRHTPHTLGHTLVVGEQCERPHEHATHEIALITGCLALAMLLIVIIEVCSVERGAR